MKIFVSKSSIFLLMFFFLVSKSKGQNFISSGLIPEFSCDLFDNSLNNSETGVDYLVKGCETYRVSISNTKISLLQYDCSSTLSDNVSLQHSPVTNPDVSIVVDPYNTGTDVFAIAVYFEPSNNEYIAEVYQIDGGRRITSMKGERHSIETGIGDKVNALRPGVYVVRTFSTTGKVWSQKLIKQ